MEVQVKELIDKIKTDGIKTAEEKAAQIVKDAQAKAETIVANAKKEASVIVADAEEKAAKSKVSGEEAIKQAGRDLILNIREKITDLFNVILNNEVKGAMDDKLMGNVITNLISSWKGDDGDLEVLLPEKDIKSTEQYLMAKLADKVKKGLDIKPSRSIDAGFHVSAKDGSAYHNFSAEGIAEVFSDYLNPRLAKLLAEGIKKAKPEA
ncbi:MAG: V-type ATP synthase subunit E [Spirochaetia bacterium]|nr:V-type ATP synthase subunit E [Spirochaetia bacterium]